MHRLEHIFKIVGLFILGLVCFETAFYLDNRDPDYKNDGEVYIAEDDDFNARPVNTIPLDHVLCARVERFAENDVDLPQETLLFEVIEVVNDAVSFPREVKLQHGTDPPPYIRYVSLVFYG